MLRFPTRARRQKPQNLLLESRQLRLPPSRLKQLYVRATSLPTVQWSHQLLAFTFRGHPSTMPTFNDGFLKGVACTGGSPDGKLVRAGKGFGGMNFEELDLNFVVNPIEKVVAAGERNRETEPNQPVFRGSAKRVLMNGINLIPRID